MLQRRSRRLLTIQPRRLARRRLTLVEPVMKTEPVTSQDWVVQNDNKPLWTRSPKEVGEVSGLLRWMCEGFLH